MPLPRQILACTAAVLLCPSVGVAQSLTRPERAWQTVTSEHFDVHYPKEMSVWAEPVAQRMESVAAAVNALVGNTPSKRVTVLIEDPNNVSNGFAVPLLEGPVVFFWPTPPSPGPTFGSHRGWGEVLAVHEYAHIAHLTYPSRNGFNNFIWKFLPAKIGPVARKSPAWVIEGYATYIEGKLTGNGRPNSVGRAAVLRTWALDGKLPTYDQLNNARPFFGGSMRYLVGSAFLEWLADKKGEASLTNLWRRMSARQSRSFAEAFRGAFGAYPDELYGRFSVEVMARSLEVERQVRADAPADGELVQHYRWGVGAPAVSPDGRVVALVVGEPGKPSRLEVWRTGNDGSDSVFARRQQELVARDPQDVAAIDSFPARRKVLARLKPSAGRSAEAPRFFDDNDRLLVVRDEPLGDGASRPDLYIWNYKTGSFHRVTHGAAIKSADPSPDGRSAVAVQCLNGICSLVMVDLQQRTIRTLAQGAPDVVWNRPRYSPDGKTVAAAVQRDGRWRIAMVTVNGGSVQEIGDESADRYSPAFSADGKQLIVVSERGGIANLEAIDLASRGTRSLTRVVGSLASPDVSGDGRVYFLSLHSRGYDVRRLTLQSAPAHSVLTLAPNLFPVSPRAPFSRPSFATGRVNGPHDYLTGPRRWRILPGGTVGPEGDMGTLSLANTDPIGRVGLLAIGGYGNKGTWRGGSLAIETRRTPLHVNVAGWYSEQRPSEQKNWTDAPSSFDAKYVGAGGQLALEREYAHWGLILRAGGSGGFLDGNQLDRDTRAMGVGEFRGRLTIGIGSLPVTIWGGVLTAQGITADDRWSLGLSKGTMTLGGRSRALKLEAMAGHVTAAGSAEFGRAYEQFAIGGSPGPFADASYLVNRIPLPGVPTGFVSGERVAMARASIKGHILEPSVTYVAGGERRTEWKRVYALEREFAWPSIGYARLPGVRVHGGVSYSVDQPYEHKVRPYLSLTYRP